MKKFTVFFAALIAALLLPFGVFAGVGASAAGTEPVQMEYLDRGTVAVKSGNNVYVSWRLLGTEDYDTEFDVYRDGTRIATVSDSTNYTDKEGQADSRYLIVPSGAPVSNSISSDGNVMSVSAVEDGLTAYAVKYGEDNVPVTVKAEPVPVGQNDYTLDFEPDKTFLWDGMTPAEGLADGVPVMQNSYFDIPVKLPASETITSPSGENVGTFAFSVYDCSTADLDGDGEYEIITKMVSSEHDVGSPGDGVQSLSGTVRFNAYKLDGTRMWEQDINLGKNVYSSAHTVQFLVYDFNLDGKAEMICQTSLGSTDGKGQYVSHAAKTDPDIQKYTDEQNASADYRGEWGPITQGEEFLTVFDGETGEAIDTIDFPTARVGNGSSFGDDSGNRSNRFTASVAYLDGQRPYAVYLRGYYFGRNGKQRTGVSGTSFDGEKLSVDYRFDTEKGQPGYYDGAYQYVGNGNHNCAVADVDGDGKDEFLTGALCMEVKDDNSFKPRWCTFMEHGDALHLGDYDPTHVGMEFFTVHEDGGPNTMSGKEVEIHYGMSVIDADTGEVMFHETNDNDTGRGIMANVGAGGYYQIYAHAQSKGAPEGATKFDAGPYIVMGNGSYTTPLSSTLSQNFRVFWDGDTYDELLDGTNITNWNGRAMSSIFDASKQGCVQVNGTKANPSLQADILGDWREEVIYPTSDNKSLRVFMTTTPTTHKLYTLMHDRAYRMQVSSEQTAYNQPPHIGYYISENANDPFDYRKQAAFIKTVHDGVTGQREDRTVQIKISFVDGEGNALKDPITVYSITNKDFAAPADYTDDFGLEDDGTSWCCTNPDATVNTGSEAGATFELKLVFNRAQTHYRYTVNAAADGQTIKALATGLIRLGETKRITAYGDYALVGSDSDYYKLADSAKNSVTFTASETAPAAAIEYVSAAGAGLENSCDSAETPPVTANSRMKIEAADRDSGKALSITAGACDDKNGINNLARANTDFSEYAGTYKKLAVSYDVKVANSGRMLISLLNADLTSQWDTGWFQIARTRPSKKEEGFYINDVNKNAYMDKWLRASFNIDLDAGNIAWNIYDTETGTKVSSGSAARGFNTLKSLEFVSWTEGASAEIDNFSVVAYD